MKKNILYLLSLVALVMLFASCVTNSENRGEKAYAYRNLGDAYMTDGKHASAYIEYMKAYELDPNDPYLHFSLGNFYIQKEKFDLAIKEFNQALKLKPDFASAKNNLGIAYMAKNDWDTAIECFNDLIDNYVYATPHFPLFLAGQAYFYKSDYKTAEKYFKKALKVDPEYVYALHWLGRTYIEINKPKLAVATLTKAIKKSPKVPDFYFDLANAYASLGVYNKAVAAYKKVIILKPESTLANKAKLEIKKLQ